MAKRDLYPVGIWTGVVVLHVAALAGATRWWVPAPVTPPEVQWVQALAIEPSASTRAPAQPPQPTRQLPAAPAASAQSKQVPPVIRSEAKPEPVAPQVALEPAAKAEVGAEGRSAEGRPGDAKSMPGPAGTVAPTRTGGADLTLPSHSASYLSNPPPPYPAISKRLGEQGRVVVRVYIDEAGQPREAQIEVKSGYSRLDNAALEAVMSWRYVPAKRGGVPWAMWFNVPVTFDLKSNKE